MNLNKQYVKDALGYLREAKAHLTRKAEGDKQVALKCVEKAMARLYEVKNRAVAVRGALADLERVKGKLSGESEADEQAALELLQHVRHLLDKVADG